MMVPEIFNIVKQSKQYSGRDISLWEAKLFSWNWKIPYAFDKEKETSKAWSCWKIKCKWGAKGGSKRTGISDHQPEGRSRQTQKLVKEERVS